MIGRYQPQGRTVRAVIGFSVAALVFGPVGPGWAQEPQQPSSVGESSVGESSSDGQGWDVPRESTEAAPGEIVDEAIDGGRLRFVTARDVAGELRVTAYRAADEADALRLVTQLQDDPSLVAVEPDVKEASIVAADDGPADVTVAASDPKRGDQWALDRLDAEAVWDVSQGAGVTVAVLDTGVATHEDLAESRILAGADFTDGDADGTGRDDGHGHGTHVSGIINASLNNNTGIAGLAPSADILPVRVLDSGGSGYWSWVAGGITWATDHGADVINMSLGGGDSEVLEVAVQYAVTAGVTVVAAAGNSRSSGSPVSYPAAYDGVTAVAATDNADDYASFSNEGSYVDIAAPGVAILSTLPGNSYASWSGTSMATPYVAATAALIHSNAAGPADADAVLTGTAEDLGPVGRDNDFGYGLVDPIAALMAVSEPGDPPATPTGVTAVATGARSGTVGWTHDGTGVFRFTATATPTGGGDSQTCTASAAGLSCGLSGLSPATTYDVTVRAGGPGGESAESTPATLLTDPAPADAGDTFDTATVLPDSWSVQETLYDASDIDYWSFTTTEGAVVRVALTNLPADYDLALFNSSGTLIDASWNGGTTDDVITRSMRAGRYVVLVEPYDEPDPDAPYSLDVTMTPWTTPSAPTGLTATPGDRSAEIRFTRGSNGGRPIRNHEFSVDGGPWTPLAPADNRSPVVVPGLVNGTTHSIRLRSVNVVGPGAESSPVSVTPRTVPGAPTGLSAVPGDSQAQVSFTAPGDGGSAITNYMVSIDGRAFHALDPVDALSPVTVPGLGNGIEVSIRLKAVNAAGTGPASQPVSVTPRASTPASETVPAPDLAVSPPSTGSQPAPSIGLQPAPAPAPAPALPAPPSGVIVTDFPAAGRTTIRVQLPAVSTATGYEYRVYRSDRKPPAWKPLTDTTLVADDLSGGSEYTVQVRGVNAGGASTPVTQTFVMPTKPDRIRTPRVRSGSAGKVIVTWAAGADGGTSITEYRVRVSKSNSRALLKAVTTSQERIVLKRLATGAHHISIAARNSQGESSPRTITVIQR